MNGVLLAVLTLAVILNYSLYRLYFVRDKISFSVIALSLFPWVMALFCREGAVYAVVCDWVTAVFIFGEAFYLFTFILWCCMFFTVKQREKADTFLVLGMSDGKGNYPLPLVSRLDCAVCLLNKYPQSTVVISGGGGECEFMWRYLISKGIDEERIKGENRSASTLENLENSAKLLKGSTVAVTSDFHLYRTKLLARYMGLDIGYYSAKTPLPYRLAGCVREYMGFVRQFVLGIKRGVNQ